jgi:hypothetical protein
MRLGESSNCYCLSSRAGLPAFPALWNGELGFRPNFIEHQLARAIRDPNDAPNHRTAHLRERRKMMQEWAAIFCVR